MARILKSEEVVIVNSVKRRGDYWYSLTHTDCDLMLVDIEAIPEPVERSIAQLRELPEQPEIVLILSSPSSELNASLLSWGCLAALDDTLSDELLTQSLHTLIRRRRLEERRTLDAVQPLRNSRLSHFVSSSPAMQDFMHMVHRVVSVDTPLLICGETGVGKERLASAIHAEGPRNNGPFIPVNCGAIPEGILESELFGHEEGAFTGASRSRRGHFEVAHGGTIFLDEIGELPAHLQVKLLRVLQEQTIQRVGSEHSTSLDVRIVAATNRDLLAEIESKRFRQDLYYRLAVVTLMIPSLRERAEDIPGLANSYLETIRAKVGRNIHKIEPAAMRSLIEYSWPGNIRELINVIERAVLLANGELITVQDLPAMITGKVVEREHSRLSAESYSRGLLDSPHAEWQGRPWRAVRRSELEKLERTYLSEQLRSAGGRIGETARLAGMAPRSLFQKMKKHGLHKEHFRDSEGAVDVESP